MKDWKAAVRNWERSSFNGKQHRNSDYGRSGAERINIVNELYDELKKAENG